MRSMRTSQVLVGVNVLAMTFLLFVLLRPSGIVGKPLANWWATRQASKYVRANWPNIARSVSMLGRSDIGDLVIFSDYECPFCRAEHRTIAVWLAAHPNSSIAVRQFPLPFHPHAFSAAVAAVCASVQGRFAAMDELLYSDTSWMTGSAWGSLGFRAGIADTNRFKSCLAGDSARALVQKDIELGRRLHITGTPTFVTRTTSAAGSLPLWILDSLTAAPSRPRIQ